MKWRSVFFLRLRSESAWNERKLSWLASRRKLKTDSKMKRTILSDRD